MRTQELQGSWKLSTRAFLAMEVPDKLVATVAPTLTALKAAEINGLRLTETENVHVTLCFLGNLNIRAVGDIVKRVNAYMRPLAPLELTIGKPGAFPRTDVPRVLWVGLKGKANLVASLYEVAADVLQPVGYSPDKRPLLPHITLARFVKATGDPDRRRAWRVLQAHPPREVSFNVDSVSLFRSRLSRQGPKYERLLTTRLDSMASDP